MCQNGVVVCTSEYKSNGLGDRYPEEANMIYLPMFDIVNLLLRQNIFPFASFSFRGLECSSCRRVFDGGLGEKVLFRAS